MVLGSPDDPAGPSGLARLAIGANGVLVVISDLAPGSLPLLYSPSGSFLGEFGARGTGPGEFGAVVRLASVPGGPLVLYDAQMGVHVFGRDGGFVKRLLPGRPIPQPLREPAILGDTLLAIAALTRSPVAPDRSVELFDLRTGEAAGGTGPSSTFDHDDGAEAVPHLAPACGGGIWLHVRDGAFTRWDAQGQQTGRFEVDAAAVDDAARALGIPTGEVATLRLHEDCDQRVHWIALLLRDPAVGPPAEVAPGAPLPGSILTPAHVNRAHYTLVLAVDAETGALLGGTTLDTAFSQFLPDGRLVTTVEDDQGHQSIVLYRLSLARVGSGEGP
jgi:hypothetical protein